MNQKNWQGLMATVRYLTVAVLGVMAVSAVAQNLVTVSDSGQPNYTIPISAPPGIAGLQPKLSLSYTGGGANGAVGFGWTLQGVSIVTRCPATQAVDGTRGSIQFTSTDKLCLDGQRLIQIDTNGNALTGAASGDAAGVANGYKEYRTEKDTFSRVRAYGVADAGGDASKGPAYFKVWTKSGQVYEYGKGPSADGNTNALITAQGVITPIVWAMARVSDQFGNYIDYKYEQRDRAWGSASGGTTIPGREWNLLEVQYTGSSAQAPANKIVFIYQDRVAVASGEAFHGGAKTVSVRQLSEIRSYINSPNRSALGPAASGSVLVRTQFIEYSSVTNRLLVNRITECADIARTKCTPPTVFSYSVGGRAMYSSNASFNSDALATLELTNSAGSLGVITGDFNGDGRTDIIRWSDAPAQNRLYISNGDGTFTQVASFNINENLIKSDGCYATLVADFNGDGSADLLRYSYSTNVSGSPCSSYGDQSLFLSTGSGTFSKQPITGLTLRRMSMTGGYYPTGSCAPGMKCTTSIRYTPNTEGANFYPIDFDGDGLLDIVQVIIPPDLGNIAEQPVMTRVYRGNGSGGFSEVPTNVSLNALYTNPTALSGLLGPNAVVDYDGDGVSDIVAAGWVGRTSLNVDRGVWRSLGDGNFERVLDTEACGYSLDFNADGKADCVYPSQYDAANNRLLVSDGSGRGRELSNFSLIAAGAELTTQNGSSQAQGMAALDMDGDGRTDILRWHDDPTKTVVYLSNGDGTFAQSTEFPLSTAATHLRKSDGTRDFIVGDFTGHGVVEILRLVAGPNGSSASTMNQLYIKEAWQPADMLVKITNGANSVTSIAYVSIADPGSMGGPLRYAGDRGTAYAAIAPKYDIISPIFVVGSVAMDSGVGNKTLINIYAYRGLKANYQGRGYLGFREIRQQSVAPNGEALTTVTRRLQDHPYTGSVSRVETYRSAITDIRADQTGSLLNRTVSVYCDSTAAAGAEVAATETAPCASSAKIRMPYVRSTVRNSWDLTSTALPTVSTTNTYNANGDPTQIVVQTTGSVGGISQTFTKTTTNQYQPDVTSGDSWIRGRMTRASTASSVPNSLASLTTSAGTSANAPATTGDLKLVPKAAILAPIMSLLLDD